MEKVREHFEKVSLKDIKFRNPKTPQKSKNSGTTSLAKSLSPGPTPSKFEKDFTFRSTKVLTTIEYDKLSFWERGERERDDRGK